MKEIKLFNKDNCYMKECKKYKNYKDYRKCINNNLNDLDNNLINNQNNRKNNNHNNKTKCKLTRKPFKITK
jgi:hypothetical protein